MIDKRLLTSRFLSAKENYDLSATIQNNISKELVKLLSSYGNETYKNGLEVGCGTGLLTNKLIEKISINKLFVNDIVEDFCSIVQKEISEKSEVELISLPGDIESLELTCDFDLIVSSSTLQWLENVEEGVLKLCKGVQKGGVVAFSFFINNNFKEIRSLTGVGLKYTDANSVKGIINKECELLYFENVEQKLYFQNVKEVLHHLKKTGVNGVKNFKWSKQALVDFSEKYTSTFLENEGYPLTYNYLNVVGRKL